MQPQKSIPDAVKLSGIDLIFFCDFTEDGFIHFSLISLKPFLYSLNLYETVRITSERFKSDNKKHPPNSEGRFLIPPIQNVEG
jgi:hypothetical protein